MAPRQKIERVTFWNIADGDFWLNNRPVGRRSKYPLLFDRRQHPKPAFRAVVEAASGKPAVHPAKFPPP